MDADFVTTCEVGKVIGMQWHVVTVSLLNDKVLTEIQGADGRGKASEVSPQREDERKILKGLTLDLLCFLGECWENISGQIAGIFSAEQGGKI